MKEKPKDYARLQHIKEAISEIEKYTAGISIEDFRFDSKTRFASIKQLEIIGEAVYHLTSQLKEKHAEVSWDVISALRHTLVHEYYGIEPDIIFRIISVHLPVFKMQIEEIINEQNIS
ncbi:MAG TPA: HepT-like ribonuclease domain-containing protein [Bacteroidia bacterium]|nr:HepT-like ribonuclease domain-containing protein [Bacteroidia bacterium]